jgi:hypothetical protein
MKTTTFQKVMYIPGLDDLIISKHWTKRQGLTTSLDEDEEITLSAKSGFSITTISTQRISTFPAARWLKHDPNYYSKVTPIVDDLPIAYERDTRIMHISTPANLNSGTNDSVIFRLNDSAVPCMFPLACMFMPFFAANYHPHYVPAPSPQVSVL